ncbi:MAG: Cna B-type domain-containing protein, partial [Anaerotignum sp.]|nr:Cna B-type domain-containing protein [Anaerotignum sp.]
TKVWSGIAEEDWEEIKVQLKDENEKWYDVKPLNKDNKWQTKWTGLDDDLAYYVVEIDVPEGMTVSYSGGGTSNQTITNSKSSTPTDPDPTTPPPGGGGGGESGDVLGIEDENIPLDEMVLADEEEVLAAETGDSNHIVAAVAAMAAALAGILFLKKRKEN